MCFMQEFFFFFFFFRAPLVTAGRRLKFDRMRWGLVGLYEPYVCGVNVWGWLPDSLDQSFLGAHEF